MITFLIFVCIILLVDSEQSIFTKHVHWLSTRVTDSHIHRSCFEDCSVIWFYTIHHLRSFINSVMLIVQSQWYKILTIVTYLKPSCILVLHRTSWNGFLVASKHLHVINWWISWPASLMRYNKMIILHERVLDECHWYFPSTGPVIDEWVISWWDEFFATIMCRYTYLYKISIHEHFNHFYISILNITNIFLQTTNIHFIFNKSHVLWTL